jgi:hypothetical protein
MHLPAHKPVARLPSRSRAGSTGRAVARRAGNVEADSSRQVCAAQDQVCAPRTVKSAARSADPEIINPRPGDRRETVGEQEFGRESGAEKFVGMMQTADLPDGHDPSELAWLDRARVWAILVERQMRVTNATQVPRHLPAEHLER